VQLVVRDSIEVCVQERQLCTRII